MFNELCYSTGRDFIDLWGAISAWSQQTFGDDSTRGPLGALKHLELEARETQAAPDDASEYADCLILILDAARRAGMELTDLIEAAWVKHQVNVNRDWAPVESDEPVRHV